MQPSSNVIVKLRNFVQRTRAGFENPRFRVGTLGRRSALGSAALDLGNFAGRRSPTWTEPIASLR